jgi:hypothetical protein
VWQLQPTFKSSNKLRKKLAAVHSNKVMGDGQSVNLPVYFPYDTGRKFILPDEFTGKVLRWQDKLCADLTIFLYSKVCYGR